ncbi:hypothetical protein [Enterovibrio coralii]|uniref:Uncharacterized protein n=1 Tax=Enterovibrio coralii TaxID=294935 RepID=A0A135I9T7_9GAMM|nr:hypothetical protein [Enterovibrio coralii]KXF82215.1 hypothetical protein ATN88_24975 [Enterovibrio coralii]
MRDKIYYAIGLYEEMAFDIFPTHLSPIVVEKSELGYRRWQYKIKCPYEIVFISPIGGYKSTIEELFPYPSYSFIKPKLIDKSCQIIAFSKDDIYIGSNKVEMIFSILKSAVINFSNAGYIKRCGVTLVNVFQ